MSESNGSKSSPTFQHALEQQQQQQQHSYHQVTAAVCPSMAIQHQHHHHFYAHHQLATGAAGTAAGAVADVSLQHQQQQHHSHHHLHHHHFQQSAAAVAGLTSSTSALSAAASDSTISSISPPFCPNSTTFRCSNRLMTLIVITILPIAITSTLICVFFLQKTNLHQYAIYSFVIFCGAFVFPFALFFFTVILNKIYKFYKREIRSNPRPSEAHLAASFLPPSAGGRGESVDGGGGNSDPLMTDYHGYHHHLLQPGPSLASSSAASAAVLHQHQYQHQHHALPPTVGQNASLICYSSSRGPVQYAHGGHHSTTTTTGTPYYYHLEDGTIVAYASPVHLDHHVSGIEGTQATSVTALPGTVVGTVVLATTATTTVDALETTTTVSADTGLTGATTTATTMSTAAATLVMEDSPPSYEMALLCPSVHSFMAASSPPAIQLIIPSATSKQQQMIEKVVAVHNTSAKTVASTTTPTPADHSRRTPSPVNSIKGVISSAAERESGAQVLVTADVVTNSQGGQSTVSEAVRHNATAATDHDPDASEEEGAAECRTETNADNDEAIKSKPLPDSATPSEVVSTTSTSTSTTATSSGPTATSSLYSIVPTM